MKNRPIIFRAWCVLDKKGSFIYFPLYDAGKYDWIVFDEEPIFQEFIGLLDKNGKKIFEGDIVRKFFDIHDQNTPNSLPAFEVRWIQQHCGFGIATGKNHNYEILGNIFENLELLKK